MNRQDNYPHQQIAKEAMKAAAEKTIVPKWLRKLRNTKIKEDESRN